MTRLEARIENDRTEPAGPGRPRVAAGDAKRLPNPGGSSSSARSCESLPPGGAELESELASRPRKKEEGAWRHRSGRHQGCSLKPPYRSVAGASKARAACSPAS